MILNNYKLSAELTGHSLDVRTVAEGSDCVLSGSRDKTVKVWKKESNEYVEQLTYRDHKNFVSFVIYLEDVSWICTASNDTTICVYKQGAIHPFVILRGHENAVCTLAKGLKSKVLISGSWDETGKIWCIDDDCGASTYITLKGHRAAVWAVTCLPKTRNYVTGSADKTIVYWNEQGEKLRVLKGHQDCVRGLIGMDDGSLISCSNDAVIKYWNEDGECIKEFHGHTNYVYSIALNKKLGSNVFVSGSEDSTIRMWSLESGNLGDPIYLPVQSVWSVTCLKNGDIVAGASDAVVRIFTNNSECFADQEKINAFQLAAETHKLQSNEKLGGIKRNDLPGPESLLQPGNSDGQTKLVRQPDGKILCYQWEENQWNLIGDVMGASKESKAHSGGKTFYEGKEYDYVFSVDISDDAPALKLPYNRNEDPWTAAQTFVHKNNLPQVYLDQIANFIITNSDASTTTSGQFTNSGYEDPFTGGLRYIPGGGSNTNNGGNIGGNVDPFTGSSSYVSIGNMNDNKQKQSKKHFPFKMYTTFDNCDSTRILDKLKEFNKSVSPQNLNVDEHSLVLLMKLIQKDEIYDNSQVETLQFLLKWPEDILFPVLDVARLAVRREQICIHLLQNASFFDILIGNLSSSNSLAANQLMSIRCITNMMIHSFGKNYVRSKLQLCINSSINIKKGSPNLQIALATMYLNFIVMQMVENVIENECQIITESIIDFLKWCTDLEAWYRCLLGLGNLLFICASSSSLKDENTIRIQIISDESILEKIKEFSRRQQPGQYEKLTECAKDLLLDII